MEANKDLATIAPTYRNMTGVSVFVENSPILQGGLLMSKNILVLLLLLVTIAIGSWSSDTPLSGPVADVVAGATKRPTGSSFGSGAGLYTGASTNPQPYWYDFLLPDTVAPTTPYELPISPPYCASVIVMCNEGYNDHECCRPKGYSFDPQFTPFDKILGLVKKPGVGGYSFEPQLTPLGQSF